MGGQVCIVKAFALDFRIKLAAVKPHVLTYQVYRGRSLEKRLLTQILAIGTVISNGTVLVAQCLCDCRCCRWLHAIQRFTGREQLSLVEGEGRGLRNTGFADFNLWESHIGYLFRNSVQITLI